MNYRCQCPKPDYVLVPPSNTYEPTLLHNLDKDNILHFKKATHFCSKCGRGICEDCCVPYLGIAHVKENGTIEDELISGFCQSCAELEREK